MIKEITFVGITDEHQLQYVLTCCATLTDSDQVRVSQGDRALRVVALSAKGRAARTGVIKIAESLDLTLPCRVSIEGYGERAAVPTRIFDRPCFAERYHYSGADLGAHVNGEYTVFRLWAPTASDVQLHLYRAGHDVAAYQSLAMEPGEKGVWSCRERCGHGTYYTYTVTTPHGTATVVDPYAKAAGVNGERGMVVDLSLTNPVGWESDVLHNPIGHYSQAVIWEIHVRDFSNGITASRYRGKYLAFTEQGLTNEYGQPVGLDYLKALGVTHVHLLPVFDYATVDERHPDATFNWGYDPKNYNVPEGSYSTDPYDGAVRIREFKQMVMALHKAGIGVIMDVVYNHTYDVDSIFQRTVPYYYYRYTPSGENASASGCGNDTASERYMYGKFMVESAAYWVKEYHLDGLRFDLMGLHDLATMQSLERAVHAVNPSAIIYGEGWRMGATVDGSPQADQTYIRNIVPTPGAAGGIAVFNDAIRDGLKGSVFRHTSRGYISGAAVSNVSRVLFGIRGGQGEGADWSVDDAMVINYMSAHDNHTLWDKLAISRPRADETRRARMNALGGAILMISKGTPFFQGGEEMLRTKGGDENSYRSDDAVNNIDWSALRPGSLAYQTMQYYQGLIDMRKTFRIFSAADTVVTHTVLDGGALSLLLDDRRGGRSLVLINPTAKDMTFLPDGEWCLVADAARAGHKTLARENGVVCVEAISLRVYVNDVLAK